MKKIVIALIILSLFFLVSCNDVSSTTVQEKLYSITAYSLNLKGDVAVGLLVKELNVDRNTLIKNIINGETNLKVEKFFDVKNYSAKEIKDFSDRDIRFVNTNNLEEFISADYIEIKQVK